MNELRAGRKTFDNRGKKLRWVKYGRWKTKEKVTLAEKIKSEKSYIH